jgi:hypothetical protein
MCFGSVKQPSVVYQGPSQEEINAQSASLDQYRTQMAEQQKLFQGQLQGQIDSANKESERLRIQLDQESAAAAAAAAQQQAGAYAATASQTEAPTSAQTTAAVTKKEKPKSNLKISAAALPTAAGTGLNIGV